MSNSNTQIAETILNQLGGNRFTTMTGTKNLVAVDNGLRMKLARNSTGANYLTITLNALDLYDMKFESVRVSNKTFEIKTKTKAKSNDNYCDMLVSQFEELTGLYCSM